MQARMHSSCILLSCLLLFSIRPLEGQFSDCHSSCSDSRGNSHCDGDQCLAACPVYIEDDDPVLIVEVEGAIHISDEDVNDQFIIQYATVEVFPKDTADFNDVFLSTENGVSDGILEIDDSENGVLYISGEESSATYQSILNNVTIWIDNKEPDAVDRIICYTVSDGVQPSDPFCITLKIILINDNTPSFSFNATTSAYEEGADGLNLLQDLVITDVDNPEIFPMQNATIRVSEWCNTTDIITVDTNGTSITVSGNGGPCITLTGNDTLENYAKVFLTARYSNSADEPVVDYSRSIVFSLFDGVNTGTFDITVDIDYVDDHVTEVTVNPSVVEVSEMVVLQRVVLSDITKLTLTDNDQNNMDVYVNQMSLMIEQAMEIEQLNLKDSSVLTNNITVTGNGTSHLQFYGRDLLSSYQEILNNIEYGVNVTEVPCQRLRTITITVGESALSDTLLIEIIPVNDHPPVLVPSQETVSYYRNTTIHPFAGISITDEGTTCTKDFFYVMKVTFENISNTETVKFYDFPWLSLNSMLCDDDSIASYSSNALQQYYNNTAPLEYFYCNCNIGSDCQLTVAGVATIEQYQILLESLVYFNEAIQPLDTERVFKVSVNDSVYEAEAVVSIVDLNKPPVLMLGVDTVNTMITYTDGRASPIAVVPELSVTDEDSLLLISGKVTLIDGTQDDELNITSNNHNQLLNVTIIDGEITLTAPNGLSVSQFEDVLKSVTYFRNAEIFESPMHEVIFTVTDLEGEESIPAKVIILFEDKPLLDLNGVDQIGVNFTIYYNDISIIPIVSDAATIIDVDSDMVTSLTVTILTNYDGDNFSLPEHNILVKSEDNGVISYTGVQPISVYIDLLKSFTFTNTIQNYSNEDRHVLFQVFTHEDDHLNSSNIAGTTIKVNKFTPTFNVVVPQKTDENLPNGTYVLDLTATDDDIGAAGVIAYSLIQANPTEGLHHFTIDETSGMITTLVSLDRESISQYVLTVEAADSGIPPKKSQIEVTVVVGDVNDNIPVFSQDIYYVNVSESAENGEVIATAVAVDMDEGDGFIVHYSGDGSSSSFSVNANGNIMVAAPLDAETTTMYTVNVVADDGVNYATAEYIITVLDVNDNSPVFESSFYETSIRENSNGLEVITVHANDVDISNDSITYSLLSGADNFAIDSTTGQITVIDLDREQSEKHTIVVQAVDDGLPDPLSGITSVQISVLDINDNYPVFDQSNYTMSIVEGRFASVTVSATDMDSDLENRSLVFDIQNKSVLFGHDLILADTSSAQFFIYITNVDYETTTIVTADIIARDIGPAPLSTTVPLIIYVLDDNDNSPSFIGTPYSGIAIENVTGYSVITVAADDLDSGSNGEMRFGLENHQNDFSIDEMSGEIKTARELDFDDKCSYQLSVIAHDLGNPRLTSTAMVDVTIISNTPPSFNNSIYHGSVVESEIFDKEMFGSQVFAFKMVCVGATVSDDVTYSLINGTDDFTINITSGVITTLRSFDRETTSQYTLIVKAADSYNFSSTVPVVVLIEDINDNDPVFNKPVYEVGISESIQVNVTFLQVVATDADSLDSGKLMYSIVYDESELFDIDENTGDISLLSMVDFEGHPTNMSIWVAVNDTDDNMDIAEVKVMIIDSNDVPPYINVSSDILPFSEGQVGLYPFGQVMISDSDTFQILVSAIITLTSPEEGVNTNNNCFCSNTSDETSCTIGCQEFIQISINFPGLVSVLNNSTTILLSGNFTHEVYEFAIANITFINILSNPMPNKRNVSVTVNDGISDSNTAIVTICLDQFPLFEQNLYNLKIKENITLNSLIFQVVAIDSDNSILIYSITGTDDFIIDNYGVITTITVIDYELVQVYNFTVHVLNQETLNTDYANVNIEILDVNDNPPILTLIPQSAVLVEPNPVTSLASSLQISDADSLPTLTSATLTIISGPGTLVIPFAPPNGIVQTGINTQLLTFTGEQSLSVYDSLLQSVLYTDYSEEPALVERLILFQVFSNEFSDSDTFNVTVQLVNDEAPVILLTEDSDRFETIFTENNNPVSLSSDDLSINDGDSGENMISNATVELIEAPDGKSESLSISLPMGLALDPTSSTKKLIVNGKNSHDVYITALKSVKYVNTAEDPSNLTRTVSFIVNDGSFNSEPAIASVVVIPVNDSPVITLESNSTNTMVTYLEGQSSPLIVAPQLTINDVDSELLLGAKVVLLDGSSNEILNISTSSTDGLDVLISNNEISIFSSFGSSLSSFQDILRSANYFISNETIPSMREVLFTVTDLEGAESVYAKVIILFNEQPVLDLNGLQQTGVNYTVYFNNVEDTIKIVSDAATIIDVDSDMATSLTVTILTNYDGDNFSLPEHNILVKSEDNGVISYTGVQPISVYIDLLRSFTFTNTIEDYSNEDRRILFQVFTKHDELSSASNIAESTIKVNKYTPSFEPIDGFATVSENLSSGTSVVDVTATDDDIGAAGVITYSLIQANPTEGLDHFTINYTSGMITTLVSLDRESISQYVLTVEATDSGIPPKKSQINVTVVVGDINDNSPVFSQGMYYVYVLENAVNGEVIATAVATDKDISDSIVYNPSDGSSTSFSVNGNGNIMVAGLLDAETITMHTVTVVAEDFGGNKATAEYIITVLDVNDNSPVIVFGGNNIVHYNEGMGEAGIGSVMLPIVSDADSNELFHMTEALVELVNHMDGEEEYLNVDGTSVPQNITYEVSTHIIRFNGEASVSDYQQALRAVTYQNSALEPSSANRSIVFQVSDDTFTSESLTGYITIDLINDNNLVLECASNPVIYVEGSNAIVIDSNLVLSDLDSDHEINHASLTIANLQVGDELIVDGSNDGLTVDYIEDGIVISGISTASMYQEILRNVSFLSSADEPLSLQREVLLTVFQSSINVSCTRRIDIALINDNEPVVDLTGPIDSTINRTAQIVHNYLNPNHILIAGENATITDLDADGVVQSLSMELTSNEFGDKLILNPDICSVLTATICFINVTIQDEAFSCTCGPDYSFASDLAATIGLTSISVITEIATPVSNTLMQLALRKLVLFEHSGAVPGSSYASEIAVVVNDGIFNSQTAISSIQVEYKNVGPTVFINEERNIYGEVEMFDGQETVTLAPNVLVTDDVGVVSQVIIKITNPVHNMDESLSVTLSGNTSVELIKSDDSTYLNLTGIEATSDQYTSILKTLQFTYSRMASLLQQQPNVSERIISITAMDADGILGQESTVTIKFSRACSVWLESDSMIDIPLELTLEELAICTSVSDYHIRISGESVTSLLPLQDLQSVRSINLAAAPNLKTLEGLENLGYFDELVIDDASALESLEKLGSNLPDDHRISVVNIAMRNCPALNDISGLRIVENITYIFQAQNCDNLHNMSGLNNVIYAGTLFFIDLSINTMSSFNRLFQATSIWIYNNNNLQSITGFQNLRSLKALSVIFNSELMSIDGLSGLHSVELVRMFINPKLCYIGNETVTEAYWQSIQTQSVVGLFNDCPARNCSDSPYCLNGGSCAGVSTCECSGSYFGGICQYYDECDSSPCQNNGTCSVNINTDTVQQYRCTCPDGTFGFNCENFSV